MLKYGANNIGKIFLGSNEIGKAYLGENLVWQSGGVTPLPYDAEIEYLAGNGSPYIDSGIECTGDLSVEFKVMLTKSTPENKAFCGGIAVTSSGYFRHHATMVDKGRYWYQNNSTSYPEFYSPDNVRSNQVYEYLLDASVPQMETGSGTALSSRGYPSLSGSLTTGSNYGIFARINGTGLSGVQSTPVRVYYFRIKRGSTVLRDFIPVRVGTVGYLYDKVGGQLFGNAGSGAFTLGADV